MTNNGSESKQQSLIRLEATTKGMTLFRNNVGALIDDRGIPVRYGLANESKQMNKVIKSSDLIGIRPLMITQDMIGKTIGQFVSIEVKSENWKYTGTEREIAQKAWIDFINNHGGFAIFANRPEDL